MVKILWLSPALNHYKARFLNHLANDNEIQLHILSGTGRNKMGDHEISQDWTFDQDKINVPKSKFGFSKEVKAFLKKEAHNFDWIMIPAEKKNLLLFMFLVKHCRNLQNTNVFSYNHPILKTKNKNLKAIDLWLSKFFFKNLDRVVFYTKESMELALSENLIASKKSYWVNNTIDTIEVNKFYEYVKPPKEEQRMLFIGRLIESKQIPELFRYYHEIKKSIADLKLEIIGDGPMSEVVEAAVKNDKDIIWHKSIVDEEKIAPIMSRSCLVFVPGHSGLSINHAFVYGRPYVTLQADKHGPEISYLINGENGYILAEDFDRNVQKLSNLLLDSNLLDRFCQNANAKGKELSVEKWVAQMKSNLLDG
ncbi:glycosyltransferase [Psychroserpens ponticola]|uniref:Glycosyltransferase n=1 Tax=Psychroserpens ponticola TaxID=2932268 RepID=A0ABY7RW13_9FLAO|nr:glycosyltransferase [Psychroserpens ponticola]WCO01129.1 glycosyltransferase [Psychroserpens ponticola]